MDSNLSDEEITRWMFTMITHRGLPPVLRALHRACKQYRDLARRAKHEEIAKSWSKTILKLKRVLGD